MKNALFAGLLLAVTPAAAHAQLSGLVVDAGPVFLTRAGKLSSGELLQSDTGYAFRGRVRYGLGIIALGADVQTSSQKVTSGGLSNLNGNYIGATGTIHPIKLLGIMPYGEVGVGKVAFGDDSILDNGGIASSYGIGVRVGLLPKIGLDAGFRLMRQGGLKADGVSQEFKYDPKLFSVMVSLAL